MKITYNRQLKTFIATQKTGDGTIVLDRDYNLPALLFRLGLLDTSEEPEITEDVLRDWDNAD